MSGETFFAVVGVALIIGSTVFLGLPALTLLSVFLDDARRIKARQKGQA